MLRNRKSKVCISLCLSVITALSLFVPMAQALQINAAFETGIQEKWQAILDADLVVGDAADSSAILGRTDGLISEKTVVDIEDISLDRDPKAEPLEEDFVGDRYIVVYKTVTEKQNVLGKLARSDKQDKVLRRLDNQKLDLLVYNRDVEKQQVVEDLQADGVVVDYVQPDYEVLMSSWQDGGEETDTTETPQDDWTAFYENISEAHETSTGAGVTVALLDGGIETTHSALTGAFCTNTSEIVGNGVDDDGNGYTDDVSGWDFVNKDNSIDDAAWAYEQGHGTHLAGILAGQGAVQGIAPAADVLPLKIFQNGVAYTSDILEAIAYAESMGARIANCSWGGGYYNRALYEAMEKSQMLFVTAAGNSVQNLNTYPVYPACFDLPNVLAVSSVGSDEKHSYFSNYGNQIIDVAAPGYGIEGAWTQGRVVKTSGTSQAAAVVSGQAALVLSQSDNLDAEEVKAHIVSTADEITGLGNKVRNGKRVNLAFSLSGQAENTNVIDVPDDTELPDLAPGEIPEPEEDGYEQYGAEDYVSLKADMPTARHGLGVVAVDGLIYAIGGRGGTSDNVFYNTVEVYNPATDTWTTKQGTMNTARAYFGIAVAGGKIYVFGGQTSSGGSATSSVEMYNPGTDTWTTRVSLNTSLVSPTATECNGYIYVIGGNSGNSVQTAIHRYNPTANSMSSGYGALNQPRTDHVAFAFDGKIYIEGGRSSTAANTFINYTEEVFDISTGVATQTGNASVSGMNAACVVDGARVFSVGGSLYKESGFVDFVEQRMPPALGNWKSGIMSQARGGLGGAVVDGVLYMIGGINRDSNTIFKTVEALEAGYVSKASLPKSLIGFKTAELGGNLYMAAGREYSSGSYTYVKTLYEYNSAADTWTSRAGLPVYARDFGLASAYGKLYLMGGMTASTATGAWSASTAIRVYDPQVDAWSLVTPSVANTVSFTHAATWLGDIYAVRSGGAEVRKFNPLTQELSSLTNRPSASTIYQVHALDDKLFVFGSSSVQIYDIAAAQWTTKNHVLNSLTAPVYDAFYSVYGNTVPYYLSFQKYSYKNDAVSTYQSFNYYGFFHQICAANNKIYIFAGDGNAANALIEYTPPVTPWTRHTYVGNLAYMGSVVIDGKAYIVGGYKSEDNVGETLTGKLYEIGGSAYAPTEKTAMSPARAKLGVAEAGGKLYAIGGEVTRNSQHAGLVGTATNIVQMYDPISNTWTARKELPVSSHSMAVASYNGKIYAFGGTAGNYTREYNPSSNDWTSKANLPTSRYGCGAAVIGDKIYVVGGVGSKKLEVYHPATNTWETTKADMPAVRAYSRRRETVCDRRE